MAAPNLYVIAGCNGAGKTTAAFVLLPELLGCREFVNADEIARGISPFNPESVAITAGKVMLDRIQTLIDERWILDLKRHYRQMVPSGLLKTQDYTAIG